MIEINRGSRGLAGAEATTARPGDGAEERVVGASHVTANVGTWADRDALCESVFLSSRSQASLRKLSLRWDVFIAVVINEIIVDVQSRCIKV